jgi:hypothetical protein
MLAITPLQGRRNIIVAACWMLFTMAHSELQLLRDEGVPIVGEMHRNRYNPLTWDDPTSRS